jgi:hypothetical protein
MDKMSFSFNANQFLAVSVILLMCWLPSAHVADVVVALASHSDGSSSGFIELASRVFGVSSLGLVVYAAAVIPLEYHWFWRFRIKAGESTDAARRTSARNALILVSLLGWVVVISGALVVYHVWKTHTILG